MTTLSRTGFYIRDQTIGTILTVEDKKHLIYFDEICKKILNSIPKQNRTYVQKNNLIFLMIHS